LTPLRTGANVAEQPEKGGIMAGSDEDAMRMVELSKLGGA
jgi:hypothetical protein